jgi:hypothetical protein
MEPDHAATYVLLSNSYAAAGNSHLSENIEWQGKEKGLKKQPGCTWIELIMRCICRGSRSPPDD